MAESRTKKATGAPARRRPGRPSVADDGSVVKTNILFPAWLRDGIHEEALARGVSAAELVRLAVERDIAPAEKQQRVKWAQAILEQRVREIELEEDV